MNEQDQKFIDCLEALKDGHNDALIECVADAFAVCETADRQRAAAIAYLESQSGGDRREFIGRLASLVESMTEGDRDAAIRGLEIYTDTVLPTGK